jgi:hypothetical protein
LGLHQKHYYNHLTDIISEQTNLISIPPNCLQLLTLRHFKKIFNIVTFMWSDNLVDYIVGMMNDNNYVSYVELIKSRQGKTDIVPLRPKGQSRFGVKTVKCAMKPSEELTKLLDLCPVGESLVYEHLAMDVIGSTFANVVDTENVFVQSSVGGGRSDIEFAFRNHELYQHRIWEDFVHRYCIYSFFIEAKNMRDKADIDDIRQIKDYIECAKRGRLGFLVSRSGFTRKANQQLRKYLEDQNVLILPIAHEELKQLLNIGPLGEDKVVEFLWRKEHIVRRYW